VNRRLSSHLDGLSLALVTLPPSIVPGAGGSPESQWGINGLGEHLIRTNVGATQVVATPLVGSIVGIKGGTACGSAESKVGTSMHGLYKLGIGGINPEFGAAMTELGTRGIQSENGVDLIRLQSLSRRSGNLGAQRVTNQIHAIEVGPKLTIQLPGELSQLGAKGLD